jgi:hypothetical protein
MRDTLQVHGALSRGVFAVVVLVSLAVLFAPASDVPSAPPGVDKLVHLGLFAALAFTGRWAGCAAAPLGGLLLGYAVASELIQGFTPLARSASLVDGLADLAGILLGLAVWAVLARRTSPAP